MRPNITKLIEFPAIRFRRILCASLILLFVFPESAEAINCRLRVFPINFGTYLPMRSTPLDVTGFMIVRCVGRPGSFVIQVGPGMSGDQLNRTMFSSGSNFLAYNIYRNAGRTIVWGDGTPPTVTLSGVRNRRGRPNWYFYPLFARAFANQAPNPGFYRDNVLITVLF